jgi:hypothetical protein
MKRQIIFSNVLTLVLLISLVCLPTTARGQQSQRFKADTGLVFPGQGQVLRVSISIDPEHDTPERVRFGWAKYLAAGCNNDGVCRHSVASQGATAPVTLSAGEAASFDIQGTGAGARVVAFSSSRNVRVTAQLINPNGEVVSFFIIVEALP